MNISKVEERIIGFVKERSIAIVYIVISILAIFVRIKMIPYCTEDLGMLKVWFAFEESGARKQVLADIIGYPPGFQLLQVIASFLPISKVAQLKFFSIIFDFICAIFSVKIVNKIATKKKFENIKLLNVFTYFTIIFAPTVMINSALWGQTDSIWCGLLLIAIYFLLDEKYTMAFIFWGVSLSVKSMGLFFLPVLIILYLIKKKFSIFNFLFSILAYYIIAIPSFVCGATFRRATGMLISYSSRTTRFLVANFNNMYIIFPQEETEISALLKIMGIVLTITLLGMLIVFLWLKEVKTDNENLLIIICWVMLIILFFLPGVHDRYMYLVDILSILLFFTMKNIKILFFPIAINIFSLVTYFNYLTIFTNSSNVVNQMLAIAFFICIVVFSIFAYKNLIIKNKLFERNGES